METQQNRIIAYLKASREELEKVTWPSKKQVWEHTLIVIVACIIIAAFLGSLDMGFSRIIQLLLAK